MLNPFELYWPFSFIITPLTYSSLKLVEYCSLLWYAWVKKKKIGDVGICVMPLISIMEYVLISWVPLFGFVKKKKNWKKKKKRKEKKMMEEIVFSITKCQCVWFLWSCMERDMFLCDLCEGRSYWMRWLVFISYIFEFQLIHYCSTSLMIFKLYT